FSSVDSNETDAGATFRQRAFLLRCRHSSNAPKDRSNLQDRSGAAVLRPCKVLGPNRTKTFHVKHFCPIGQPNRTKLMQNPSRHRNATACSPPCNGHLAGELSSWFQRAYRSGAV